MTCRSRLTCAAWMLALLAVAAVDTGTSTTALAASSDLACRAALVRQTRQYFEHLHRLRRRCLHRVYTGKASPLADCIAGSGDDASATRSRALRQQVGVVLAKTCSGVDLKQLGFPSGCSSPQPGIFDVSDLELCLLDTIDAVVADMLEVESPASVLLPARTVSCAEAVGLHGGEMVRRELRARTGCLLLREQSGDSIEDLACRDQLPPWGGGTGDATADRKIIRGYISLLSAVPYACKTAKLANIGYADDCEDLTGGRFSTFDLKWCVFDQHRAMASDLVDLVFPRGPVCGNGRLEDDEQCDDGNASDTDACLNSCTAARCGDGVVRTGVEQCDDGNSQDTDACRNDCALARCGDGIVHAGAEQCDDGNSSQTDPCRNDCKTARCGDGFLCTSPTPPCITGPDGGPESCDDGNTADNDGCNSRCGQEFCGDGIVQTGLAEQCDDGQQNSNTTPDACRGNCKHARCGDGVIDSGEACDPPNGTTCRADCTPQLCGNGIRDSGEECDDGNSSDTDRCLGDCTAARCGDGTVCTAEACTSGPGGGPEQCDAGAASSDTVADRCRTNCAAPFCGDGVTDSGEDCDDGAANGTAGACGADCKKPTVCSITVSVTSSETLGALKYQIDYMNAPGEFAGSGLTVHCTSLVTGGSTNFFDDDGARFVLQSTISLGGFTGPFDVGKCDFETSEETLSAGDFTLSVIDASTPQLVIVNPTLAITSIDCSPGA